MFPGAEAESNNPLNCLLAFKSIRPSLPVPKGTLTAGHSVKIKNMMIFDVTPTDRS